ncbi:Hsp20/alpha crystallin family protein [Leisingera methylohalidivorans]|uniref:Heat shock protein Hsp20 n=1 Tax=Leisingera methylohalidivorans DSM 14336 TaxID=999552 RepID=V9VS82_9RHOB|nr:Hsp20/alpha crystallin family protein [Leisingera methylohalidivorans]AHD00868.1 heat shock protein Hsp20 [Leisingera methylohalidivorans DSM 14336]
MAQELTPQGGRGMAGRNQSNGSAGTAFMPMVDIFERDETTVILADMPGVAPDGIDVTLERQVLTLKGSVEPHSPEGYRRISSEYREGDYMRVFTLSDAVDQNNIKADFKNGVLRLELPRAVGAKPRKISVKSA